MYVPQYDNQACQRLAHDAGLKNVTAVPFGTWTPLGENGRFMILQDTRTLNDSGILIEYKGHRILNANDSMNLNHGALPNPVDVILISSQVGPVPSQFAGQSYIPKTRSSRGLRLFVGKLPSGLPST